MKLLKYMILALAIIPLVTKVTSSFEYNSKQAEVLLMCYSIDEKEKYTVKNVKNGDLIECSLKLPYYSDYEITDLDYTLTYGSGLELVNKTDDFKTIYLSYASNSNNYSLHYRYYYEGEEVPVSYIFKVIDNTSIDNLYINLTNIKLSDNGKKYNTSDYQYTFTNYQELDVDNFNFDCDLSNDIKDNDTFACLISLDNTLGNRQSIDYNMEYGANLELIDTKEYNQESNIVKCTFRIKNAYNRKGINISLSDIYTVIDNETYYTKEVKKQLVDYDKYQYDDSGIFSIGCYYEKEEEKGIVRMEKVDKLVQGKIMVCDTGFETYATDPISKFNYTIDYSDNLKLIDVKNFNGMNTGNKYIFDKEKPTSVFDGPRYYFEVIDNKNGYFAINNIEFTTENGEYYHDFDKVINFKE